ncbi:MAG: acyltransferase family protein [Erysipelotrichaceae bacterium]|nr:acyltransferase family protein [Erysipelotrichaceae bacterium]
MKNKMMNFELLRIISMFLIVVSHFSVHGKWENLYIFDFNRLFLQFIRLGGGIGNILFFMITGYFLCEKSPQIEFKGIKKIIYIILKTWLYNIILLIFTIFFFRNLLNWSLIFRSFFPILFQLNWFASVYVFLILFSPFINRLFFSLNKNESKVLIIILFISIAGISLTGQNIIYDNLRWAILWYITGGYIKIFGIELKTKKFFLINFVVLLISLIAVLYISSTNMISPIKIYSYYYEMQRFLFSIVAIEIFIYFEKIHINEHKYISLISSSCFGIYLLHDNVFTRDIIWKNILYISGIENSMLLILYSFFSSILVFCVCLLLDKLIRFLFEKLLNDLSKWLYQKISVYLPNLM